MTGPVFLTNGVLKVVAALGLCLMLIACESSEERAEGHYQSGLELLGEGDVDRARVEFRNALRLVPTHLEARRQLGRVHRMSDNLTGAEREFRRVAEQVPADLEAQVTLSEIAFMENNWALFDRHAPAALEIAPDDPEVRVIDLASRYRQAALDEDAAARAAVVREAEAIEAESVILQRILIDGYLAEGRYEAALATLDDVIAAAPDTLGPYNTKVQILIRLGDNDAIEAELRNIVDRFPEEASTRSNLLRFYLSNDRLDAAEAFLTERAEQAGAGEYGELVSLIQFKSQYRGVENALAELDERIKANPQAYTLRALRATLNYDNGAREEAIAELQDLVGNETIEIEADEAARIKTALAGMLMRDGNEVGARRLVEEILAANAEAADALKMQAQWLIDEDKTEDAISALRTALAERPQDAAAMTLMAAAYERAGNTDLMMNFLSLAVEASNSAPEYALRYARALLADEKPDQAENTLVDSLRVAPSNPETLLLLGRLYLDNEAAAGRVQQVIDTLNRIDSEEARRAATGLELSLLARTSGTEQALSALEGLVDTQSEDARLKIALIQARLQIGETSEALGLVNELVADHPDNTAYQAFRGLVLIAADQPEEARGLFKGLLEDNPRMPQVWIRLIRLEGLLGTSRDEIARLLDQALQANPEAPDLLWAKASSMQAQGDIEGAIGVYEALYERNSTSVIIANNLASLLATFRRDEESLNRAARIARRLRDTEVPAFQDTYGWIQYRTGNYQEALNYLEPAAASLTEDGTVQYHLGATLAALDRRDEALDQLRKALPMLEAAGATDLVEEARTRLAELEAAGN